MALPLQTRAYTAGDLYSQALSSIWTFYSRVYDPSYALAQDADVWEVLNRDPKFYQGAQERLHAIAGPNWRMFPFNNSKDPNDVKLAKIAEDAFRRIPHFSDARLRLAQAVFRGQSAELMLGRRQALNLGGLGKLNWWVPTGFKHVDPRRFTIRPVRTTMPDGTTRVRGELYMSTVPMQGPGHKEDPSARIGPRKANESAASFLTFYRKVEHPEWFIRVVYNDEESRLGYGRGMLDALYFYCWVKTILIREGLQGVERWSQGIVHGKIDENRVGDTTQNMEAERTKMLNMLTQMRSRHVIVTGKSDEVEIHTGGGEGHQIVSSMLDYVDDCIMGVCTGAVLMSSKSNAGSLGSLSRDEVGRDTQRGVILFDQNKMDEDISLDAVGMFVRMNWPLLTQLGLASANMPQFKTVGDKHIDPDRAATRFAALAQQNPDGLVVRKDEYFEQLGMTPPGPEDDKMVIGGPGKMQMAQFQMQQKQALLDMTLGAGAGAGAGGPGAGPVEDENAPPDGPPSSAEPEA